MKFVAFLLLLFCMPIAFAMLQGNTTVSFTVVVDVDQDGIFDNNDTLIGNESFLNVIGITNPNITVGGNSSYGTFSDVQLVQIFDQPELLVEFYHNFSYSTIHLANISITVTTDSIFVDMNDQLAPGETKTIYLEDSPWIGLCANDNPSVSSISDNCSAAGEVDFTSCISSALSIGNIVCTYNGSHYAFSNLTYSAARGYGEDDDNQFTGGGSDQSLATCYDEHYCTTWSPCSDGKQERTCRSIERCVQNLVVSPSVYNPSLVSDCSVFPSCVNARVDGLETDVDCGGLECGACENTKICTINADCISENCIAGICESADSCRVDSDCQSGELCIGQSCRLVTKIEQAAPFDRFTFSFIALLLFLITFILCIYYVFTDDTDRNV